MVLIFPHHIISTRVGLVQENSQELFPVQTAVRWGYRRVSHMSTKVRIKII